MKHICGTPSFRIPLGLFCSIICATLSLVSANGESEMKWIGTWSASVQEVEDKLMPGEFTQLDDTTIRQIIRVSVGGPQLRVRLSNAFAPQGDDLKISAVSVAEPSQGSGIKPNSAKPITFNGKPSVSIKQGVLMVSDPVVFDLSADSDLVVTMHVEDAAKKVSGHRSARGPFVFLKKGNHIAETELPGAAVCESWIYLGGVDVLVPDTGAAVVCLGDSITDGKGSTSGSNRRWPNFLSERLRTNAGTANVGVLNQGIGGNCLYRGGIGQCAIQRIERDVLSQPGIRWLIVFEGINDLGGGKTSAEEIILALEQVTRRGKERGLKVFGATITPAPNYLKPGGEEQRQKVNQWIRASGTFDEVLDFDAALRNPADPAKLIPEADSGDHLHLNDEGYRILANTVDLRMFSPSTAHPR